MGKGILVGFLLHFFQFFIMMIGFAIAANLPAKQGELWGYGAIALPFFAGFTQIVYMIPAILVFRRKQQFDVAKGIALVAALTFLLNASCVGLMWFGSRK